MVFGLSCPSHIFIFLEGQIIFNLRGGCPLINGVGFFINGPLHFYSQLMHTAIYLRKIVGDST